MFKVGMGESPEIPSTLSSEGVEFVDLCLDHNPNERWNATELLQCHNFCKVSLKSQLPASLSKANFAFSQVVIGDECECDDKKASKKNQPSGPGK